MKLQLIPKLQNVMGFQVAYIDPKTKQLHRLGFLNGNQTIDVPDDQAKMVMEQHNAFVEVKGKEKPASDPKDKPAGKGK